MSIVKLTLLLAAVAAAQGAYAHGHVESEKKEPLMEAWNEWLLEDNIAEYDLSHVDSEEVMHSTFQNPGFTSASCIRGNSGRNSVLSANDYKEALDSDSTIPEYQVSRLFDTYAEWYGAYDSDSYNSYYSYVDSYDVDSYNSYNSYVDAYDGDFYNAYNSYFSDIIGKITTPEYQASDMVDSEEVIDFNFQDYGFTSSSSIRGKSVRDNSLSVNDYKEALDGDVIIPEKQEYLASDVYDDWEVVMDSKFQHHGFMSSSSWSWKLIHGKSVRLSAYEKTFSGNHREEAMEGYYEWAKDGFKGLGSQSVQSDVFYNITYYGDDRHMGTLHVTIWSFVEHSTGLEAAPGDLSVNRKMGGRDAPMPGSSEQWFWISTEPGLVNRDIVAFFVLLGGCILMIGAWLMTLMQLRRAMNLSGGCRAQRIGKGGALTEPLIFETEEEVARVKLAAPAPVATKEEVNAGNRV